MNLTKYADSGLHGWKGKLGERLADSLSGRTRWSRDQLKLVAGAVAFLLSLRYVVKTVADVARR